jgi:hypothetical protein
MKKLLVCASIGTWGWMLTFAGLARADIILVDFGNNLSFRGTNTVSPDANGNYWNSVDSGAFYANLVDQNNTATTLDLGFDAATGTDYFNGPSGAVEDPSATVYNASALGNLGVDGAVYDYYVNSRFQLQQLDPTKTYTLTFFGSHKFNTDTQTLYTVYSDNTYTIPVASVLLTIGTTGGDHNQDTVATISGLTAQAGNALYIGFAGSGGNNGYLNALEIHVVPEPTSLLLAGLGGLLLASLRQRARR